MYEKFGIERVKVVRSRHSKVFFSFDGRTFTVRRDQLYRAAFMAVLKRQGMPDPASLLGAISLLVREVDADCWSSPPQAPEEARSRRRHRGVPTAALPTP